MIGMEMGMQNVDGDRMDMDGDGLSVVLKSFYFGLENEFCL